MGELAEFLFKTPGPVLAIAKIALTEDPWALPGKGARPSRTGSGWRLALRRREGEERELANLTPQEAELTTWLAAQQGAMIDLLRRW